MLKNLFKKTVSSKYPLEIYKKFYEAQPDFFEGKNIIANQMYQVGNLLEAERDELESDGTRENPAPYWQFYHWVGDCLTALDPYRSHPMQPRDESYSGDVNRASRELASTPRIFGNIKAEITRRGAGNAKLLIAEMERLESMIDEKLNQLAQQ